MTDLLHQQAKAQEFSMTMFAAIGNAATVHFLGEFEKEMKRKEAEILATDKSDEEKAKDINDYANAISQRAHLMIRHHTALLVGGFTQDMFPGLMPKPEETKEAPLEVVRDGEGPAPITVGVRGIESEERVLQ